MLAIIVGVLFSITPPENPGVFELHADTLKRSGRNRTTLTDSVKTYVAINRIIIIGNKLTRNSIIQRELSFKKGVVVSLGDLQYFIEKDQRKLYNLRIFNTATIKPIDLGNGLLDLLIEVQERWYTFPVPIFQLSDRNFNEWWENYNHDFS
ncbi:MAG: POTRA domain-containing protein, partial [Cyclobacteriaceae bacterium]